MYYQPSLLKWKVLQNCSCPDESMFCIRPVIYTKPVECVPDSMAALLDNDTFFLSSLFGHEIQPQQQQIQQQPEQFLSWALLLLECVSIMLALSLLFGCRIQLCRARRRRQALHRQQQHHQQMGPSNHQSGSTPRMISVLSQGLPPTPSAVAEVSQKMEEELDDHKHWWGKSITCAICRKN